MSPVNVASQYTYIPLAAQETKGKEQPPGTPSTATFPAEQISQTEGLKEFPKSLLDTDDRYDIWYLSSR